MSDSTPTLSAPSVSLHEAADDTVDVRSPAPPPEWQVGEEQLREQCFMLRDRVRDCLKTLLEGIDQDLFAPLQATAHEGAAVHVALMKTSHFHDPVDEVPPHLRWARVRDYRRDTMTRVIAPLRRRLVELDIGAALHERWQAYWDHLASLPPRVPTSITRQEPDTLYAQLPTDSFRVAVRKHLVQVQRRFRLGTSPTENGPFYAQEVPLRALAAYHLRVRLPDVLDVHERAIYQRFARAVAAFERAVTTWTHRLLDAERHLDRPHHHLPRHAALPDPVDVDAFEAATPSTSPPASISPADVWAAVSAEAEALNEQLQAMASLGIGERPARMKSAVRSSWSDLDADIEQADSFLLARKDRTLPAASLQAQEDDGTVTRWAAWHRQATDRLAFCEALTASCDATYERQHTFLRSLLDTALQPLTSLHADAARTLRTLQDDAATLFDDAQRETLPEQLREVLDRASHVVRTELREALQQANVPEGLRTALNDQIAPGERLFDDDPKAFELHALAPPSAEIISPDTEVQGVDLQSIGRQHFDAVLADTLRDALNAFRRRIETLIAESSDVPDLLQAPFDSALTKLGEAAPDDEDAVTAAHELVRRGLARTADAMDAQVQHARAAFTPLAATIGHAFATAWTDLHDRARTESRVREPLLELRTIRSRDSQKVPERNGRHLRAVRSGPPQALPRGSDRSEEEPQQARPEEASGEAVWLDTLDAFTRARQTISGLPLTYQQLFSFQPLTDPALLANRQADLARLQRHVDYWRRGFTNAMILTGAPGSGRTSLLNVVQRTVLSDADVHWIELDDRLQNESAFARRIVRALDLPLSTGGEEPPTLSRVREYLLAQPRQETPRVGVIEHLEHLMLRTVGGTDLIGPVLTFLSRTAPRVLWLSTISQGAWHLLERTTPTASHLVHHHTLAPIDRTALETLIMTRHRQSGLRISFESPDEPNHTLGHRLRNAPTEERAQAILQAAYFDALHAECGSNIALALFYWFRSVRLDENPLVLHVRPIQPLNLDLSENLSMQQAFLLKALLDHATLTIDEYSTLAQVPPASSLSLFESLSNALLLQPADKGPLDADAFFAPIEPDRRYRIHPLAIHPVVEFLRGKDLLH